MLVSMLLLLNGKMSRLMTLFYFVQLSLISYGQIIADHTVVDKYNDIPKNWIDSVRTILVWIPGMSHGYGYFRGGGASGAGRSEI